MAVLLNLVRRPAALLVAASVAVLVWPYFRIPGAIIYNRYFESYAIFAPGWTAATEFQPWTYQLHLGYATLTEISYVSLVTAMQAVLHVFGTAAASELFPAVVQCATFAVMFAYVRRGGASTPLAALAGFFYAANPFFSGAIHEGYESMLLTYAMLPAGLMIVDLAERRRMPALVALVPLVQILISMYKLPEILVNWAAIVALRWPYLRREVLVCRRAVAAIVLALGVNAYWAFPMLLNAALHASLPVETDTASEISITTQWSSLTNVLLMRVFGLAGLAGGWCPSCSYYAGGAYNLGMAVLVAGALWQLARLRAWRLLAVTVAAFIFATGYRYADELLGVPYAILMALPTHGIFRGANLSLGVAAFTIAAALPALARRSRALAVIVPVCVALVTAPWWTGSLLERGAVVGGVVTAPNAYVRLPPDYARARSAIDAAIPADEATLLVPNAPFAAYRWGAYVQDFLPAYLARPTLEQFYWPQPNRFVQAELGELTARATPAIRRADAMRALRIGGTFWHGDVVAEPSTPPVAWGRRVEQSGPYVVYRSAEPAIPMWQAATTAFAVPSVTAESVTAGALGIPVVPADPARPPCPSAFPLADYALASSLGRASLTMRGRCEGPWRIHLRASGSGVAGVRVDGRPTATSASDGESTVVVPRLPVRLSVQTAPGSRIVAWAADPSAAAPRSDAVSPVSIGPVALLAMPAARNVLAFNQSDDPSWQAYVFYGGIHAVTKTRINGYANGWFAPAGAQLLIVDWAGVAFAVGLAVAALCAAGLAVLLGLVRRRAPTALAGRPGPAFLSEPRGPL